MTPFRVRTATIADVDAIVSLLRDYMKETFGAPWYGSPETLAEEIQGSRLRFVIAETPSAEIVEGHPINWSDG